MIILGLDTSTTATGWAVLDNKYTGENRLVSSGLIIPPRKLETIKRINYTLDELKTIVDDFKTEYVAIEDMNVIRNKNSLKGLIGLIVAIELYLDKKDMLYIEMTPSQWRKIVGIKGKTRDELKKDSIRYVKEHYNVIVTDDEADAICIAEAGATLEVKEEQ